MPMVDPHLQMHKASIAVEDADMTRTGYGQAIEMYSVIDVTANDLRYETVEGFKHIQAESREKTRKLWWKREAAAKHKAAKHRRSQKDADSDSNEYTQSELEDICHAEEDHRLGTSYDRRHTLEEGGAASSSKGN